MSGSGSVSGSFSMNQQWRNELLGDKTVVLHYNGFWKKGGVDLTHKDYVCGKSVNNWEIDGDVMQYRDFVDDVCFKCHKDAAVVSVDLSYLHGGRLCEVKSDLDLLDMWVTIQPAKDHKYHIYANFQCRPPPTENSVVASSDNFEVEGPLQIAFPPPTITLPTITLPNTDTIFNERPPTTFDPCTEVDPEEAYNSCHSSEDDDDLLCTKGGGEDEVGELAVIDAREDVESGGEEGVFVGEEGIFVGEEEDSQVGSYKKPSEDIFDEDDDDGESTLPSGEKVRELYDKMIWPTIGEFRTYMVNYAVAKRFSYKQEYNKNLRVKYVCTDPKCEWYVYCRRVVGEPTMMLRSYNPKHTCKSDGDGKCKNVNARWVAEQIEQDIRNHKMYKPKDIVTEVWEKHGVKLSYWTRESCCRVRGIKWTSSSPRKDTSLHSTNG